MATTALLVKTPERLHLVYEELRKLCSAVAETAYTGIDLTILRSSGSTCARAWAGCSTPRRSRRRSRSRKAVAPVVTRAKITYCVGNGCFWDANSPDSTCKLRLGVGVVGAA
ncbi:hypothetical protein ACPA54_04225 [Uniformispora flossi]|uniref:hypothetical protein n=1 Tax=Uniformispora flossi TaxID=3390723 RepID=UPI003C2CFB0F